MRVRFIVILSTRCLLKIIRAEKNGKHVGYFSFSNLFNYCKITSKEESSQLQSSETTRLLLSFRVMSVSALFSVLNF